MEYTFAFDVYGTLINTSGIFNSIEKLIGDKAITFVNTWRNKQLEYSFRRGLMKNYCDFSICTRDALEFSCKTFNTNLNTAQKNILMQEYTVLPCFNDVEEGLKSIKNSGHRLFAFSNGSTSAVNNLLSNAKIMHLFDGVVSVESTKTYKPNPIVYEHFNKETKSTKSNSLLVSSNSFDVIGATSYGMKSAWLQRKPTDIFDPWGIEPTITINKLTDLTTTVNSLGL